MSSSPSVPRGSRLISRVLPVAVKFWLQTQLDEIGELTFDIQATDRQVLSGNVPGIALSAQGAVYQGVRITDVTVQASDIQINIGQVLRGKPLRLKQAFPIEGQVTFNGEDLAASSTESSLAVGLIDVWQALLTMDGAAAEVKRYYGIELLPDQLRQGQSKLHIVGENLRLHWLGQPQICVQTQLAVEQGHRLCLTQAHWVLPSGEAILSDALTHFQWDLGNQVELRTLEIANDQLTCDCRIMVQP